jgi:hypothetical protein
MNLNKYPTLTFYSLFSDEKLEDSLQECKTTAYNLVGDRVGGRVEASSSKLLY